MYKDTEPRVSIIIPCYNSGDFIEQTIISVLSQEIPVQIVAVDDGSTDGTLKVLEKYGDEIEILQSAHKGVSAARNLAVSKVKSRFTLLLDSDDALASGSLFHLLRNIDQSGRDVIYGNYCSWNDSMTRELQVHKVPRLGRDPLLSLSRRNISPPGAIMFPTDAFEKAGDFDPEVETCEDWDFMVRLARAGYRFKYIDKEILYYRRRLSSSSNQAHKLLKSGLEVIRRCFTRDDRVINDRYLSGYHKGSPIENQFYFHAACMGLSSLHPDPKVFKGIVRKINVPKRPGWFQFGKEFRESLWWNSLAVSMNQVETVRITTARAVLLIRQVMDDDPRGRDIIMSILSPDFRELIYHPGPKKAVRLFRKWRIAKAIYKRPDTWIPGNKGNEMWEQIL